MPTILILIGVPGSGKSTYYANSKDKFPTHVYINMDSLRKQLTGSEADQSKNAEVAALAQSTLKAALAHGWELIVWDNTSARPKYRKEVIQEAKKFNYKVEGVYFKVPIEVAKDRNSKRKNVVPEEVIDNMFKNLEQNPPKLEEGFDSLWTPE